MSDVTFDELADQFWRWRLQQSPEFASQIGFRGHDSALDSYAIESFKERVAYCKDLMKKLKHIQGTDAKNELNIILLLEELSMFVRGTEWHGYFFPINFLEGAQVDLERLFEWVVFEEQRDYDNLACRCRAFPKQIEEIISLLSEGIKRGFTTCEWSMKGVVGQLDNLINISDVTESPLFKPYKKIPTSLAASKNELQAEGKKLLQDFLLPSFRTLRDFLTEHYLKSLRPSISINSMAWHGESLDRNMYSVCLRFHLTCDMTPEQVHQIGCDEVARIRQQMEKIMKQVKFSGSLQDFFSHLRTSPEFYYQTPAELVQGYKEILTRINPKLSALFTKIPGAELRIEALEAGRDSAPLAYYIAGTSDGKRPGVFYVNTSDVNASPKYEMMSLALHESLPGHHLQASYALEMKALPQFRRYLEDRRYSDAPARFALNTAYIEGWGLYSEALGEEMGLYDDPYSLFGRYSNEIYRACRLVVDSGMHQFGWPREQAIKYMQENIGTSLKNIENEIDRYITWPGQATAYKIGEIKLHQLRKFAESTLGDKFVIGEFHDVVLKCGAVPLAVLEDQVKAYVSAYSK